MDVLFLPSAGCRSPPHSHSPRAADGDSDVEPIPGRYHGLSCLYFLRLCVKEESRIWGVKAEGLKTTLKCLQRVLNGALWEEAWGGASLSPEKEPAGHLSCLWPFSVFLRVFLLWTARHSGHGGPTGQCFQSPATGGFLCVCGTSATMKPRERAAPAS